MWYKVKRLFTFFARSFWRHCCCCVAENDDVINQETFAKCALSVVGDASEALDRESWRQHQCC